MKKALLALAFALALPLVSSAEPIKSIDGLTNPNQLLSTPVSAAADSMHMSIVNVGTNTHNFKWDGTPWRVNQGGTGTTTFSNGGLVFFNGSTLTQSVDPIHSLLWDSSLPRLSIGGTTTDNNFDALPLFIADETASNNGGGINVRTFNTSNQFGSVLRLEGAGGTIASPAPVQQNMTVGAVAFGGYDGSIFTFHSEAQMRAIAEENWTPGATGLGIEFTTTAPGGTLRTEKMRIAGNGNVGIGTNNPEAGLDIRTGIANGFEKLMLLLSGDTATDSSLGMIIRNYTQSTFGSAIRLEGARGTTAAPEAVTNGMTVGAFVFGGYDGEKFPTTARAQMRGIAEGDWTPTETGLGIAFTTTAPGGTARSEKMRITGGGSVGIGTNNPQATLDVHSADTTTTLQLDSNNPTGTSCIIMKDSDGDGYTYITASNGVLSASTEPCN